MSVLSLFFVISYLGNFSLALNPCAEISETYLDSPDLQPRVPAKLAYQCLIDVDFDAPAAVPWLNSLEPYIEWQTTTAYLKDPPDGYLMPAIDVHAELSKIKRRANSTVGYPNEYEFGRNIYKLFQRTYDGHFRYVPRIMSIFGFGRPVSLISYSSDGIQTPKVFVYSDLLASLLNETTYRHSPVEKINGQEAIEFLEEWAMHGILQDPDALYNNVFFSLAQASLGDLGAGPGSFAGAGRGAYVYPGADTNITFANGTMRTFENFALVLAPFGNIKNGSALYQNWINPKFDASLSQSIPMVNLKISPTEHPYEQSKRNSIGPPPGYPTPILISDGQLIGGYYLDQPGYEEIAVLSVPSFMHYGDYQDVAYDFLDNATRDGKTKLIIDLSANGGGSIMEGYSLFLNLFPDAVPNAMSRFRNHETFNIIGETISERMFYYPFDYDHPPNRYWNFYTGTPFNYRSDVDINNENFRSWQEKNPSNNQFAGDNFTALMKWNLSDPTIAESDSLQVNGYGSRTGLPPSRPFEPENIVLLYDGYCASTCTIFSELMTQQIGNIKTVSIGGRPDVRPMQTTGGTKGTNNWGWAEIRGIVRATYELAPDQAGFFNSTAMYTYQQESSYLPFQRGLAFGTNLNVRDGIRYGDKSQTPLQFVYEAADCRLYYTAEMTVDVVPIWEKVADVAWDGDNCAVGGFGDISRSTKRHRPYKNGRGAHQKETYKRKTMSLAHVAAIEKILRVLDNKLQAQPGLMLP